MSKNFELLREAGWGQEYFSMSEQRAKNAGDNGSVGDRSRGDEHLKAAGWSGTSSDEVAKLVQRVFIAPRSKAPRMVVFSGVQRRSGSGWVCARVSQVLAKHARERVCAVDTNFHAPSLHRYFREQNLAGLADAVRRSRPALDFARQTNGQNLWLLAAGNSATKGGVLSISPTLETRLTELRSEFGYILIDSPPIIGSAQAILSSQMADGIILVLDSLGTAREVALKARYSLESASASLLGVVLHHQSDSFSNVLAKILR